MGETQLRECVGVLIGDYSIFLGRLAVTEQRGRDTDTDRGFDVLGLRLIGLVIGEGRSMEDCSR